MSPQVKICGITNLDDALDAVELGASWLGFNLWAGSPRYVPPSRLAEILLEIPGPIGKVGVFVNADPDFVINIATELNLDLLQFHGDEAASYVRQFARPKMKAFRPRNPAELVVIPDYACDYILIDTYTPAGTYGGTGILGNWELSRAANQYGPVFLSGGLNPDNIEIAVNTVKPFAVDVASGVESSPGKKDYRKMEEFIKRAKGTG